MTLGPLTETHLTTLDWTDLGDGWFRIVADVTCGRCGAYQAADSDPTPDQATTTALCLRLLNHGGWRVDHEGLVLCPNCTGITP